MLSRSSSNGPKSPQAPQAPHYALAEQLPAAPCQWKKGLRVIMIREQHRCMSTRRGQRFTTLEFLTNSNT